MPTLYDVVCNHCGKTVQLSPDAPRCPVCGEDLHTLLPPDYSAHYFYQRAAELASRGDVQGALAEAERGIGFVDAPQLRLLAAILSRRLGNMENVRKHVAAIPVDDRLRPEAEWLLRSQQTRKAQAAGAAPRAAQPAQVTQTVQSVQSVQSTSTQPAQPDRGPSPASGAGRGRMPTARPAPPRPAPVAWTQRFWAAMALLLVFVVGALGWVLISRGPEGLVEMLGGPIAGTGATSGAEAGAGALPLITPAPLPQLPPTATPAPATVPPDLVLEAEAEQVADASGAATGLASIGLDLQRVLAEAGRADLAAAPISAVVANDRVALSGVISMTQSRTDLVEIVSAVPGVAEVDAVGLLVRLPPTYTVQAGDTLWTIAYKLYGEEPARVEQLAAANRDTLPAPEALGIGMVLNVPPIEE